MWICSRLQLFLQTCTGHIVQLKTQMSTAEPKLGCQRRSVEPASKAAAGVTELQCWIWKKKFLTSFNLGWACASFNRGWSCTLLYQSVWLLHGGQLKTSKTFLLNLFSCWNVLDATIWDANDKQKLRDLWVGIGHFAKNSFHNYFQVSFLIWCNVYLYNSTIKTLVPQVALE